MFLSQNFLEKHGGGINPPRTHISSLYTLQFIIHNLVLICVSKTTAYSQLFFKTKILFLHKVIRL